MHPDKLSNVQKLSPQDRYGYFIRKVADTEEVWVIHDQGEYVQLGCNDEKPALPVWPEKEFAEMMLVGSWMNCSFEVMTVYDFVEWLDELEKDGIKIAAFPTESLNAVVVTADEMKSHLIYELRQYE